MVDSRHSALASGKCQRSTSSRKDNCDREGNHAWKESPSLFIEYLVPNFSPFFFLSLPTPSSPDSCPVTRPHRISRVSASVREIPRSSVQTNHGLDHGGTKEGASQRALSRNRTWISDTPGKRSEHRTSQSNEGRPIAFAGAEVPFDKEAKNPSHSHPGVTLPSISFDLHTTAHLSVSPPPPASRLTSPTSNDFNLQNIRVCDSIYRFCPTTDSTEATPAPRQATRVVAVAFERTSHSDISLQLSQPSASSSS